MTNDVIGVHSEVSHYSDNNVHDAAHFSDWEVSLLRKFDRWIMVESENS